MEYFCQAYEASFHSDNLIYLLLSDIIIPVTMLSDCPMSKLSDPFATSIIPNLFPLSIENENS